jgi:hypothetical protein
VLSTDTTTDLRPATYHAAYPVLVLANSPSMTSLLCGFVSLSGHTAASPRDDEPIEQAVLRIRPRVALIESDHASLGSTRVVRRLGAIGARTVLYSAWPRNAEARHQAQAMDALFFALPITHHDFHLLLRTALLL